MDVTYCFFHQDKSFLHQKPSEVLVEESGMAQRWNRIMVSLDRFDEKRKDNHFPLHRQLKIGSNDQQAI